MIEILQGETLSFALEGEGLSGYNVRVALRPSGYAFRRDCSCGEAIVLWDNINIVNDIAVWTLSTEQSEVLPVGQYTIEVALRDKESGEDVKEDIPTDIIKVKQSYTVEQNGVETEDIEGIVRYHRD